MRIVFRVLCSVLLVGSVQAQISLLQSGPMVGAVDMREAKLWAQTTVPAKVHFVYYDSTAPQKRFATNTVQTRTDRGCTATCVADSVLPGKTYIYELFVNGNKITRTYKQTFKTPPLWQWRTDPPAMRIALGSCAYINEERFDRPGKAYGGEYSIYTSIAKTKPDVMLWLGDNIYLREPDWNTHTGIYHRYTHTRSTPEMQALLASCSNLAIWDDHDFGPNDSDRGFWNKDETLRAFADFWANPSTGIQTNVNDGITSFATWGDVDIFLLDNRWFKTPNKRKSGERTILGKEQLEWLIDNLHSSTATFKLVCIGGQVLNSAAVFENYATYSTEREYLIDAITKANIQGVFFLTGDRHHTELSLLKLPGVAPIHDLTVSPLSSSANPNSAKEDNSLRVDGTWVGERNFATLDITGKKNERTLTITVCNIAGKELWKRSITQAELKK